MSHIALPSLRRLAPLVLVACAASSSQQPMASPRNAASGTATDLSAGMTQARWGQNVKVTFERGKLVYASDGIPNHARNAQYAIPGPNGFRA
jgi:hypothetical protein